MSKRGNAKSCLAKKGREKEITVSLPLSVARDLVSVLAKFSLYKADSLRMNQHDHASRLLNLNLFRVSVEDALRRIK